MARKRPNLFRRIKQRYDLLIRSVVIVVVGWMGYQLYLHTLEPIRVGLLFPTSGPLAIYGRDASEAVGFAIDQINASGGLLGRPIEPLRVSAARNPEDLIQQARVLYEDEGVTTVFACVTAGCLRTLEPVAKQFNGALVYAFSDDGLHASEHVLNVGSLPNQTLVPGLYWADERFGKRFFVLASDSLYGRVALEKLRREIDLLDGELVGHALVNGSAAVGGPLAARIQALKPDVVLNLIRGGESNVAIYKALHALGLGNGVVPTLFLEENRTGLIDVGLEAVAGNFAIATYRPDWESAANRAFLAAYRAVYGDRAPPPDAGFEAAYSSVLAWAEAVRRSDSTDASLLEYGFEGVIVEAPSGTLTIAQSSHHPLRQPSIGSIRSDGSLEIVWTAPEPIEPMPRALAMGAEDAFWSDFLDDLYRSWGDRWEPPSS